MTKSDIIFASGQLLTEEFPDDYDEWDDKKFDQFIQDNLWEPFEKYDSSFIWEQIEALAMTVRIYIDESEVKS